MNPSVQSEELLTEGSTAGLNDQGIQIGRQRATNCVFRFIFLERQINQVCENTVLSGIPFEPEQRASLQDIDKVLEVHRHICVNGAYRDATINSSCPQVRGNSPVPPVSNSGTLSSK